VRAHVAAQPCTGGVLFQAAVDFEHFNPTDPSYQQLAAEGDGPAAYNPRCVQDWAVAVISRPNVGRTDGATLFRRAGDGQWVDVGGVGTIAACTLTKQDVPDNIALSLANGQATNSAFY
jgi:hypothetical protein